MRRPTRPGDLLRSTGRRLLRPQLLAFLPALVLAGYWYGGEGVLVLFAITLPLVLLVIGMFDGERPAGPRDGLTGLPTRQTLVEALDGALADFEGAGQSAIAMAIELDEAEELREHLGSAGYETVVRRIADRLTGVIRPHDTVVSLGSPRFGLAIVPRRGNAADVALGTADRIAEAVAEPISIGGSSVYVTASIGFCLARRAPELRGMRMLRAAEQALDVARRAGRGSIRAYTPEMRSAPSPLDGLAAELDRAFEEGQIRPWIQPQISTDTGAVSGVELLARWDHPGRGLLPPSEFLPVIDAAGQMERLGETMLFQGLSALRAWDRAGLHVPRISLNCAAPELRDPRLVDRLKWELDRFDLTPERIAIEVLETVVAQTDDDSATANVAALAALGCTIDLDDFGTGHASIGNIRRFAVSRIKIDRSFVTRVDRDPDQQKMVAAILSMSEQLDLETIAEGVETVGEHAMLAQLGCHHVQGYGIARPMPVEDSADWLRRHAASLSQAPRIGGAAS